jgi:hypothetical protein
LKYIKEFDECNLAKSDAVLIIGKAKDLRAIQQDKLESVMKQVEMPKQVFGVRKKAQINSFPCRIKFQSG